MAKEIEYMDPDVVVIIGLDTDDREDHPLYDERVFLPVDESLVRNIMVYGIQVPVITRQQAGTHYVVDGRQRVRAARKAKERQGDAGEHQLKVPVRATQGEDSRVAGIMVLTNELRKNDEILAKARKAARLLDLLGDINEVAIAFGRTVTTIRNWLSLVEADPHVHAAVMAGQVSAAAAIEISKQPRDSQRETLDRLVKSGAVGATVSEAEAKKARRESDASAVASKPTAAEAGAGSTAKGTKAARAQRGIKRVWLRRALKTDAAKSLKPIQRKVLEWVATGESERGDWFDDFRWEVEAELEDKAEGTGKAKATPTPEPEAEAAEELPPEAGEPETTDEVGVEFGAEVTPVRHEDDGTDHLARLAEDLRGSSDDEDEVTF